MLMTILMLSTLLIVGTTIVVVLVNQIKMSSQADQSVMAIFAADAGAENCLYQVRYGSGACAISGAALTNGATYDASYALINGNTLSDIKSTGHYSQTNRKIELTWPYSP